MVNGISTPVLTSTTATSGARRRLPGGFETIMSGAQAVALDFTLLHFSSQSVSVARKIGKSCGLQIGSLGFACGLP